MIKDKDHKKYLDYLINNLINKEKNNIVLNRVWSKDFSNSPGVYIFFENDKVVYVGETTSIKERMRDILDTRHHTLRRKIGAFNFSDIPEYKKANSKTKFPSIIEDLVSNWMVKKMKLSFIEVRLGRKELEDLIIKKYNPKYNSISKRGKTILKSKII